ncbi:hypothetical protein AAG906_003589 [Vitis piasezkii]
MSSRKEEERNEKIIRGLMKLPPNRRCINCNSLGPQYVCTNFWTFVCTTCSGIHREFTHRVKSVSMAKFTSQEVEALQKGGNQRARELYLKDWDTQRQRLPDISNVDKVRDFIKSVYVDRRYAVGKTSDKPPRDTQNLRDRDEETRRASSYHSYSQSPPYDYQYEDRRYGKQAAVLTRKPGSDRGLYDGKISSFVYSPGRLSDQMCEDRFANDGSGDPFRSNIQSPNFQKGIGFSSPPIHPSRDILIGDAQQQTINTVVEENSRRDGFQRPQRTTSSGSFGSFDSNSMSIKSANSSNFMDVVSEPEQSTGGAHQDKISELHVLPRSSVSGYPVSLDLFDAPFAPETVTSSASSIDLFQLPVTSSVPSVDLFQQSSVSSVSSMNPHQASQTSPPSAFDFFAEINQQQSAATLHQKLPELSVPKNEGWATFDTPTPMTSIAGTTENCTPAKIPSTDGGPPGKLDSVLSIDASMQWPLFQDSNAHGPSSSMSNPWDQGLHNVQASTNVTSTPLWNAFEDAIGHLSLGSIQQSSEPHVAVSKPSTADQFLGSRVLEDPDNDGIQRAASAGGPPLPSVPTHVTGPPDAPSELALMGGTQSQGTDKKSSNPFDLPYDSDLEQSSMFLDMSSLQAALPSNPQLPSAFLGGVTQPWFPQKPVTPYIPAAPQGGLAYVAGSTPSSQLPNGQTQGPVASIGGNPFA